MGNTCPAPHSKHVPFCENIHQDVANMMHVDELIKEGLADRRTVEQQRYAKLCACFDGLNTKEELHSCATGTWECTAKGRKGAINNPNCIGWVEYMDAAEKKIQAEYSKIKEKKKQ